MTPTDHTQVHTILLIPNAEFEKPLLACGVTVAIEMPLGMWILEEFSGPCRGIVDLHSCRRALVLAWAGQEVASGVERAFEVSCPGGLVKTIGLGLFNVRPPTLKKAYDQALYSEWRNQASIVFLGGEDG